jgi:hypothetical protein
MAGSVLGLLLLAAAIAAPAADVPVPNDLFAASSSCIACHTGIVSPAGEDVPIATGWRASMMANAARDPYWQAAVRRETLDHPAAAADIEHECAACHMPMVRFADHHAGRKTSVFAQAAAAVAPTPTSALAMDGVSCSVCHQITPAENLGTRASFNSGFDIERTRRVAGGRHAIDAGRTRVMASASGFTPEQQTHLQSSLVCATCHTLYTHALTKAGEHAGELPEQVPFLEWRHSAWRGEKSCQSCHMPGRKEDAPISAVLPQPRAAVAEHDFRGGNAFMMRILRTNAAELGVTAPAADLLASEARTIEHLRTEAARLAIEEAGVREGRLALEVVITNLAGHKLPTAYPSRRVWIHLTVRNGNGTPIFESGAVRPDGSIAGNVNDSDGSRYEPHYTTISRADQVQIYETILADSEENVTTGLISAVRYLKDNRMLPRGFDKATAEADIAVRGEAAADPDFTAPGDRVRYTIDVGDNSGPFTVEAELLYQPIAFRWAENLRERDSAESKRFARMYDAAASASASLLATSSVTLDASAPSARVETQQ